MNPVWLVLLLCVQFAFVMIGLNGIMRDVITNGKRIDRLADAIEDLKIQLKYK